ncbi:sinapoylglucose--choline O-sinapoyltransferase [Ranunculus cassubicifolius]
MAVIFHSVPVFFVLLLLFISLTTRIIHAMNIVESLPGFEGPLPFRLETGYVEAGEEKDAQLFYYFIESERNPKEDPILIWLSGGPRCSSLAGLLYEVGPITLRDDYRVQNGDLGPFPQESKDDDDVPSLVLNPYGWTQVANVIFLDQPVGAGFSYSKSGQESNISDTKSALNTYQFLQKWFQDHQQFLSNPLYAFGNSYSGTTIPVIVQEIINGIEAGQGPLLNFKGYSIGNPITNRELELNARIPFAHGIGLISDELYESLRQNCKGQYVNFDASNVLCSNDYKRFLKCISGINNYQILEPLCQVLPKQNISSHNRRSIESVLKSFRTSNCRVCKIDYGVGYNCDVNNSVPYLKYISTKCYRSLIYSGDHDLEISHISTRTWIRSLNSSIVDDWRPWHVDGQVGGFMTTYSNGMTFATVKGAGHTTAEYQPKETFALFKKWIFGDLS